MKRNKIFISGQITDNPGYRGQFKRAEAILRFNGYRPVNPTLLRLFGKPMKCYSWHVCMAVCLWHLLWCHHVFMLHNWSRSRGARIEHRVACFFNKHIIYQYQESTMSIKFN